MPAVRSGNASCEAMTTPTSIPTMPQRTAASAKLRTVQSSYSGDPAGMEVEGEAIDEPFGMRLLEEIRCRLAGGGSGRIVRRTRARCVDWNQLALPQFLVEDAFALAFQVLELAAVQ